MLLDRAARLADKIARYNQLKGTAEEAAQFETRAGQFSNVAAKLDQTRDLLRKLKDAEVAVAFTPTESVVLAERARALRTAVQDDPHVLADPPFDLRYEFTARLLAIHDLAAATMLEAWSNYVRNQSARHSDDILNTLAAIPQFKPIVARMRNCRAEMETLASTIPPDPQASVLRLRLLLSSYQAAWEEMTAEGIPESVIRFLKACAGAGAPLNGLTDEVREWLAQRNLLSIFRIRI